MSAVFYTDSRLIDPNFPPNKDTCSSEITTDSRKRSLDSSSIYENIENISECNKNVAERYKLYDYDNGWKYDKISTETVSLLNSGDYSFCNTSNFEICKLKEKTDWKTTNPSDGSCSTVPITADIVLEDGKTFNNNYDEKFVIKVNKTSDESIKCEERWYDWFTIPDYHYGNKYSLGVNDNTGEINSFNYCNHGYILTENGFCIKRSKFDYGKVKNFIHYTPYALIFLLGLTKADIIDLHKKEMEKNKNKKNTAINETLYDEIYTNQDILNLIYSDIKKVIKKSIENLLNEPLTYVNIVPPYNDFSRENEINYYPDIKYQDKIYLEKAYSIAKKITEINNNIVELSQYKNELAEVSGLPQNSVDFSRQFTFLQKSCSICFSIPEKKDKMYDIFDKYSSKIINNLKKINKNYIYIAVPKLTEVQILKQSNPKDKRTDPTLSEYNSNPNNLEPIFIREDQLVFNEKTANIIVSPQSYDQNNNPFTMSSKIIQDIKTESSIKNIITLKKLFLNVDLINNSLSSVFIKNANLFVLSLLMIIWLFCVIILLLNTWKNFAYVFNYIIYGFIFCIYGFFAIFALIFGYRATNFRGVILQVHKMSLQLQLKTLYATKIYNITSKGFLTGLILIIGLIMIIVLIVKELIKIGNILALKSYPSGYSLQAPYVIKKGGSKKQEEEESINTHTPGAASAQASVSSGDVIVNQGGSI